MDKLIAIVACLPYLLLIVVCIRDNRLDLERTVILIQVLAQVLTMFARRAPVRITFNPLYWVLAFVA